eukprot:TRINITY_DN10411_c0_g1_i3.p1 TRINITY_DN10411_c0_g1~~TRINITY_DN10411_c0_g1_i3.p1  ORF type:complete len:143 (+),score=19.37 TRINITY_DN10411_c0_g1_i3:65-493(+)
MERISSFKRLTGAGSDEFERVELFISCQNLKKMDTFSESDPSVRFYVRNKNGTFEEKGRTETVENNRHPIFIQTFVVDYYFERNQTLLFEVWDEDAGNKFKYIGEVTVSLSLIHISEPTRQAEISYAVFCLKKKTHKTYSYL